MTDEQEPLTRLRQEAERLGLPFSDEDLEAILEPLERTREALARSRLKAGELEPPYLFTPAEPAEVSEEER
ncbi:MAG: hypothetical protein OXC09_14075 [Truepera sp.]|nr:hypothetical protein [Truepera sp.]